MKKILLLGSDGYIGSHLKTIFAGKYEVTCVDSCLFGDVPCAGTQHKDFDDLTKEEINSFENIILLAGYSSVKSCEDNMRSVYDNNVRNFVNLLDKMNTTQKLIYASSGSVLSAGNTTGIYYDASNWYDLSKYAIDQVALLSGKNIFGLRFGTVNGWSPVLRIDLMINSMVYSAINNGYIECYGANSHRPILAVKDLGAAMEAIINKDNGASGIYDLASFNTVVRDIANQISEKLNVPVRGSDHGKKTSPYSFEMDCSFFCNEFNFQFSATSESVITEVYEGIKSGKTTPVRRDQIVSYE